MEGNDFCGKYAIVGLGKTKIGYLPQYNARTLEVEACRAAIEDAGLKASDIDGAIHCMRMGGLQVQSLWRDAFPRILGCPVNFFFSLGRGAATVAIAITTATRFLDLGLANYVLIGFATDALTRHRKREATGTHYQFASGEDWAAYFGGTVAASSHAFFAARHMHEYGTTSRQLGAIAVAERQWACMNPDAQMYGRPITIDDHQNSPWVVWPYHFLDMCLVSDGGCAIVVTTAERAQHCRKPPVYTMGVGFGEQIRKDWWEKKNYTRLDVEKAKENAFRLAGIELGDIDVALLYDCFTAEVLFQLEDYGWCKKGEGGPFVEAGSTAPGGSIPVNTGGGQMSYGHWIDFTGVTEAIIQLRREAGQRQVKNCEIALLTGHGGEIVNYGMASIHSTLILGR